MKLSDENIFDLQQGFISLTDEAFGGEDNWYGSNHRGGLFGSALTVWLWMFQIIEGASMQGAVEGLLKGAADLLLDRNDSSKRAQQRKISGSTGGYSRARQRLPEVDVEDITKVINDGLREDIAQKQTTYFIDGTTVTLARNNAVETEYPKHRGNHGECNHPLIRIVFATEATSGILTNPQFGAYCGDNSCSEQALSAKVIDELEDGALLIGDRNFGVFSVISHAETSDKKVLTRLSESQAAKFLKDEKSKGELDKSVTWNKSYRDTMLDAQDATSVTGRFIRTYVRTPGFRPVLLMFFTTSNLTVDELVKLYGRRVDIETDIRNLKSLFKMEELLLKTPDMIRKHIHILFASYNLVRNIIIRAASILKLPPRKISFKSAVGYIKVFGSKILKATTNSERQDYLNRLLTVLRQTKLPNRKHQRYEPRMLTRKRKNYLIMKGSRDRARKNWKKSLNNGK